MSVLGFLRVGQIRVFGLDKFLLALDLSDPKSSKNVLAFISLFLVKKGKKDFAYTIDSFWCFRSCEENICNLNQHLLNVVASLLHVHSIVFHGGRSCI